MLVPAGHRVVNARLRSLYNPADWLEEQMYGVSSLFFVRELARQVDADWPSVQANLERLQSVLLNRRAALANVTLDADNWARFEPMLVGFLDCLPDAETHKAVWKPETRSFYEGLAIPSQVNYVGKGADLVSAGYTPDGSISVITNYLGTSFLWEKIRVQGGAYGAFSAFSRRSGVFTYLSYRDPNLLATLDNFDATAGFLQRLDLDEGELTKSIIGAIGEIDAYQLPDAKGFTSLTRYLAGETEADRQLWREQVLTTTADDFRRFGEALEALNRDGAVVALGSQDAIEQANAARGGWLQVKRIL
jgi:Zn-dependent M16 (insulinase) family peptidase